MKRKLLIAFLLSTFLSSAFGQSKLRILFVGNSLTYVNDLPAVLKEIGAQDQVNISYELLLLPDYSLEDHWREQKVVNEIRSQHYDFVVAQQGPSALPESQQLLLEYAGKFANECRKYKTRFALYMVWPSRARSFDFKNVIQSYTRAAAATGSLLCPAGKAWLKAQDLDPQLLLYGPDDFHPSRSGTFLAALVIYEALRGNPDGSFLDYGKMSIRDQITTQQFNNLLKAAAFSMKE